jgi:Cu2+-exporting ATPase
MHEMHGHNEGINKHEGHNIEMFKSKFWLSLVLSVVVVIYSDVLQRLFGFKVPSFPGSGYIPAVWVP